MIEYHEGMNFTRLRLPLRIMVDPVKYVRDMLGGAEHVRPGGKFYRRAMIYAQFRELPQEWQQRFKATSVNEVEHAFVLLIGEGETEVSFVPRKSIMVVRWRTECADRELYDAFRDAGEQFVDGFVRCNGDATRRDVRGGVEPRGRRKHHHPDPHDEVVRPVGGGTDRKHDDGKPARVAEGAPAEVLMADRAVFISIGTVCPSWRLKLAAECGNRMCGVDFMGNAPHAHKFVSLDLETTGLETPPEDQIVEIAYSAFHDGEMVDQWARVIRVDDRFYAPKRWAACEKVHHITVAESKAGLAIEDARWEFLQRIARFVEDGFTFHAFNASFDRTVLRSPPWSIDKVSAERYGWKMEWGECMMRAMETETARLGWEPAKLRLTYGGHGSMQPYRIKLSEACAIMKIQYVGEAHRATADSERAGLLYQEILRRRCERALLGAK